VIDIHSHILYGIDDGSKSFETSLEMLRLAADAGTTDIVATPHCNGQFPFQPEVNRERIAELQAHAPTGLRIHSGCDFHLSYENVEEAFHNPRKFTINGLNYLLVEFPDGALIPNIGEVFERLRGIGVVPVITHPERNWMIQQNFETMESWVGLGALVQVTAGSLTGRFGKPAQKFAERTIDRGICHFVASDAHDTRDRHPKLQNAYELVRGRWGEAVAEHLFTVNGKAVIEGVPIAALPPAKRKRWFFV
jgi:protein-tyrosine phosphatase